MSRVFVAIACLLAVASAKQQKLRVVEPQAQGTHEVQAAIEFEGDYSAHAGKKYSTSSELTSLAHSSAQQAKNAVQSQQTAGIQASLGAQSGYARAASEAAATAQVALVAKQVIVQNLEHQLHDAEHQLQAESAQYQQTLAAASAAQNAAQQSQQQLAAVTSAAAAAQTASQTAEHAAAQAASAAASQHAMILDAKQRVAKLSQQLHHSLGELQDTEASAQKAAAAAHVAQSNAAAAAQVVAVNSAQNQIGAHDDYHH